VLVLTIAPGAAAYLWGGLDQKEKKKIQGGRVFRKKCPGRKKNLTTRPCGGRSFILRCRLNRGAQKTRRKEKTRKEDMSIDQEEDTFYNPRGQFPSLVDLHGEGCIGRPKKKKGRAESFKGGGS